MLIRVPLNKYLCCWEKEVKHKRFVDNLQDANLHLATLAGNLQEDLRLAQLRLTQANQGLVERQVPLWCMYNNDVTV